MQNMEKEIRKLNTSEVRARGNRDVDGYALVFNSLSEDLGGFKEQIVPEAIGDVIDRSDVFALFNHTPDKVLARSRYGKGSLLLTPDDKGLRYEFSAPNTDLGDTLLEFLYRGDIDSSSFAFTVAEDKWEKQPDGTYIRTILKFDRLFDVSPVFEPAYQATSVKCARFAEIQEEERLENERLIAEQEAEQRRLEEEKEKALEAYYNNLKEEIEKL
jgi:HK97 family phage prohead protease